MSVIRQQQKQIDLRLSSPSAEDAVATVRMRRDQARKHGVRLKVKDDGRFVARIPGSRNSSPPYLKGRFEPGDGGVAFKGVIFESHASVAIPRGFTGMGVLLVFVAILLAVTGNPTPGSYICGVIGVLFGLIGYGLGHFRKSSFDYDCKNLMGKLTLLMPEATPLGESGAGIKRPLP